MKTSKLLLFTIILSLKAVFAQETSKSDSVFSIMSNKYFGQNPPKDSAIIFAPGIISVSNRGEYALSISPIYDEYF